MSIAEFGFELSSTNAMKSVLVVDDSDDVRSVTAMLLASMGFVVTEAADGPQAIAAVSLEMPDAVLLDYTMPGMNGVEVAMRIKALAQASHVRIVLYTAARSLDVLCIACATVLSKPAELDEIVAALNGGPHPGLSLPPPSY